MRYGWKAAVAAAALAGWLAGGPRATAQADEAGAQDVGAQIVLPVRTIPAGSLIGPDDVVLRPSSNPPAADVIRALELVVGREARRSLYADRPIRRAEIGPVTLVERNARVTLRYRNGAMHLTTFGRALDAGGIGELIPVMNMDSRRTVHGRISGLEMVDVGS